MMAGAGGLFSQLAVGLAGGMAEIGMPNGIKMGKMGPKPTINSLPDKVTPRRTSLETIILTLH